MMAAAEPTYRLATCGRVPSGGGGDGACLGRPQHDPERAGSDLQDMSQVEFDAVAGQDLQEAPEAEIHAVATPLQDFSAVGVAGGVHVPHPSACVPGVVEAEERGDGERIVDCFLAAARRLPAVA